jgi:hypothetical protein
MGSLTGRGSILDELDRVFLDPTTNDYDKARRNKDSFIISDHAGNWQELYDAYKAAGVKDDQHWRDHYLQNLGSTNIFTIAKARYDGLTAGVAMKVYVHPLSKGIDVVVSTDTDGSIIIDSPYKY